MSEVKLATGWQLEMATEDAADRVADFVESLLGNLVIKKQLARTTGEEFCQLIVVGDEATPAQLATLARKVAKKPGVQDLKVFVQTAHEDEAVCISAKPGKKIETSPAAWSIGAAYRVYDDSLSSLPCNCPDPEKCAFN